MPTSAGSSKKHEFQKNIYFCFTDYAKAFVCVDHQKLWKILKKMGIPDHFTCFLRNLYAGPVANWLSEEALQIAEERREVKIKRERERY